MSQLCQNIIKGCIAADCNDMIYAGMAPTGYIANYDDVASMTWTDGNTISGITMKTDTTTESDGQGGTTEVTTSRCFYTVQQLGNQPFEGTQTEMVEGTYGNKFDKTVVIAVPDNSPVGAALVDSFANGKFIFIGQNDYKKNDGSAKYEVYGSKKGLKATSIVREAYGDNEGMWVVTLVESGSPISSAFFYTSTESATDTAVKNLLCDCED